MGSLHFLMRTPMEWFFKPQKTVETAPSAFVVAQTATCQIFAANAAFGIFKSGCYYWL
jgi:hypothetical protein